MGFALLLTPVVSPPRGTDEEGDRLSCAPVLALVVPCEVRGAGGERSTDVLLAAGVLALPDDVSPFKDGDAFVCSGALPDDDEVGSNGADLPGTKFVSLLVSLGVGEGPMWDVGVGIWEAL